MKLSMQGSRRAAAHEARRRDERRVSGQSSEHKGLAPAAAGAAACSYGSDLPVLRAAQGKEVPQHDPMDPKRQINRSRQAAPLPLLQHSPWRAQRHHEQDRSTSGSLLVQIYGVLSTGKARSGVFWGEEEPWGRQGTVKPPGRAACCTPNQFAEPRSPLQAWRVERVQQLLGTAGGAKSEGKREKKKKKREITTNVPPVMSHGAELCFCLAGFCPFPGISPALSRRAGLGTSPPG